MRGLVLNMQNARMSRYDCSVEGKPKFPKEKRAKDMLRRKVTRCLEPSWVSWGVNQRRLHLEISGPCFNSTTCCW